MIYCKVCNLPIKKWEEVESRNLFDASYHGGNWYKHRTCFTLVCPPPLYHRRVIPFSFIEKENAALKNVIVLERFGAKVSYFNTEECHIIYPDDLPEKIYIYTGESFMMEQLCGISGLRTTVMEKLPDTLELIPPPKHLFHYYFNNSFSPPKLKPLRGKLKQFPPPLDYPIYQKPKRRRW